ncbi:MAG: RNA dependent RNA polymerase [Sarcina sp.]
MAKQLASQKYVFKIHTKRLQKAKWNLNLGLDEAKKNKEVISLGDSQVLTFLDELNGVTDRESLIATKKREIKKIKREIKESTDLKEKNKLIKEHKILIKELSELKFIDDYICLIIDKAEHFDKCNQKRKTFFVNGKMYRRLVGTPGGIKNRTIVYVSDKLYPELAKRIDNGRNIEKKMLPAKLEAYRALTCSNSIPVSNPKGVLVVNDCITKFKSNVIEIDDSDDTLTEPVVKIIKDYEVELNDSDGFGLIAPNLSERWKEDLHIDYISSGFCVRNAFCKGMLFTFDFHRFADKIAKNEMVTDAWGNEHNIKDIDMILTTSMLKLWDSYDSIEHYLRCCEENKYAFRVAKVCPKELENERTLNYQFIQSFELNDSDIEELIKPTVDEINGSLGMDYAKTLLYLRGQNMTEYNAFLGDDDYSKALMVEPELIKDSFVQQKILNMRRKRINDAKVGTLNIRGNYAVISGDPYSLCQSIFGLEVTGLLKANQCYSKKWNDTFRSENSNDKFIVAFRAPMSCHNNIRKLEVVENEEVLEWYKYMTTVNILSSWDTVTHAMNGADKDKLLSL